MRCRFCGEKAVKFEPKPMAATRWKGLKTEPSGVFEGIAFCRSHYEKFHQNRISGIKAAQRYLKKKGKF